MHLSGLDLIVVGVPLVIVLVVAMVMRRYLRSVADYLAASRCAGRYLICTAAGETGSSVMVMMVALEIFSNTGFSLQFWNSFTSFFFFFFFFGLLGLVAFRFRQTRSLTFHQFFEVRYSRSVRVLASFLNVLSGIFNFGIQPAVGARFFVFFCGMPQELHLLGFGVPTFAVVMIALMAMSIMLAMSGGQISVMVTDAIEGMVSAVFYLIVAVFIMVTVSYTQMREALLSGTPGKSFVDPFDISNRTDFNGWYVIFGLVLALYWYRGSAWNQGFAASAKSAHEGRMAHILGNWRVYSYTAMTTLISIGAFTLLTHPDFAGQQAMVNESVQSLPSGQLQTQMRMPAALGILLTSGVKGAFCAVALFGILAAQGVQLHSYGATILQDVVLPLRKKPLAPDQHVRWLRITAISVGVFACFLSLLYKPVDYLIMITTLIGVIYMGGVGIVVWGGLYWRRGTAQGAWAAMTVGAGLGILSTLLQQFWTTVCPILIKFAGEGAVGSYLAVHTAKCPLNGMQLALIAAGSAGLSYIVVSLFTCRAPFDLDAMLHRGAHRPPDEQQEFTPSDAKRPWYARIINVTEDFTRADKVLAYGTSVWTLLWKFLAVAVLLWSLFVGHISPEWWFGYAMVINVWLTLTVAVGVTIWFAWGLTRDLRALFKTLSHIRRDERDDGLVHEDNNKAAATPRAATQTAEPATTSARD